MVKQLWVLFKFRVIQGHWIRLVWLLGLDWGMHSIECHSTSVRHDQSHVKILATDFVTNGLIEKWDTMKSSKQHMHNIQNEILRGENKHLRSGRATCTVLCICLWSRGIDGKKKFGNLDFIRRWSIHFHLVLRALLKGTPVVIMRVKQALPSLPPTLTRFVQGFEPSKLAFSNLQAATAPTVYQCFTDLQTLKSSWDLVFLSLSRPRLWTVSPLWFKCLIRN